MTPPNTTTHHSSTPEKRGFVDQAFAGLPIPGVKTQIEETLSNKNAQQVLENILSGEITMIGEGEKGRYVHDPSRYYIYTLELSDNTQIEVIFYSYTNEKLLLKVDNQYIEVYDTDKTTLLAHVSQIYTLPKYTSDGMGGMRLLAS